MLIRHSLFSRRIGEELFYGGPVYSLQPMPVPKFTSPLQKQANFWGTELA